MSRPEPTPDPVDPFADQWERIATIATPAWFDDQVLTVGSVNPDGTPAAFSLAGPWMDVAAPGTAMTSLSPTGSGLADGTVAADAWRGGSGPLVLEQGPATSPLFNAFFEAAQ